MHTIHHTLVDQGKKAQVRPQEIKLDEKKNETKEDRDREEEQEAVTLDPSECTNHVDEPDLKQMERDFWSKISVQSIKQFGGNITAQNHADGGAVFNVTLTAANSASEAAE